MLAMLIRLAQFVRLARLYGLAMVCRHNSLALHNVHFCTVCRHSPPVLHILCETDVNSLCTEYFSDCREAAHGPENITDICVPDSTPPPYVWSYRSHGWNLKQTTPHDTLLMPRLHIHGVNSGGRCRDEYDLRQMHFSRRRRSEILPSPISRQTTRAAASSPRW